MVRRTRRTRRPLGSAGFTLIELLVVISIIAVLISVLLPALTSARRMGQRGACMAALRDLAKGATEYGTDNDDWIVGSPDGSGAYLDGQAKAYGACVQTWDFMGPIAKMWGYGITLPSKNDPDSVVASRFNDLRNNGAFLCAGNKFLAIKYTGSTIDAGVGWLVSYNTQRLQLLTGPWPTGGIGTSQFAPPNWKPSIQRIGPPSEKIFCGDGARYSSCTETPDYDLSCDPSAGGAFSDAGAFSGYARSLDRCMAPGNGGAPGGHANTGVDAREYAYRHSTGLPPVGAAANAFKANFAFYDGHVEILGDLESSNPYLWLPKGSVIDPAATEIWPDTIAHFGLGTRVELGRP